MKKKKNGNKLSKPIYLGLSILELSKLFVFWHDYVKPKYGEKTKLYYMDTNIIYIKTDDIYKDLEEYVEATILFIIF